MGEMAGEMAAMADGQPGMVSEPPNMAGAHQHTARHVCAVRRTAFILRLAHLLPQLRTELRRVGVCHIANATNLPN